MFRPLVKFFGEKLAKELAGKGKQADLLLGNNVLAQVPDLCDFVAGMKVLLKPSRAFSPWSSRTCCN